MEQISKEELEERISLLRKFKFLLLQQRAKFQEYLTVLEKQQNSIETENADKILAHTELEQQVVKNIMSLQKVIVPMSKLYGNQAKELNDNSVAEIQKDLDDLQKKVLAQNERNRELLKTHIVEIRKQIATLKNPYKATRNVYSEKAKVGNLVTIEV